MKLYGIAGKGTGKVGSMVYAISGGEQIVRQYNPIVANPNTERQVTQRSKFKLLTQLAAAVDATLAFRKQGLVSARNQFIAKNYDAVAVKNGEVTLSGADLQITPSSTPLTDLSATNGNGDTVNVSLANNSAELLDRVVYHAFTVQGANMIEHIGSTIVDEAGADGKFAGVLPKGSSATLILAYGVKDNSAAATIKYAETFADPNTFAVTGEVSKLFSTSDYSLTMTVGKVVDGLG